MTLEEKLVILSDAAKYDAACTSSGVNRNGEIGKLGNTRACGICHSFSADGRCISLLKILYTNECVFDCKYCINRASNDIPRATFTPEEIAQLTIEFYRRNYIEGLFLSSGVLKNPTYTMEQIYHAIWLIRNQYHFNGYIHVKIIPGTPQELITQLGYLVDRVSVNMELPTGDSLKKLCPHKSVSSILKPMRSIQKQIHNDRLNRLSSYRLLGTSHKELHYFREFLRFSQSEQGILFSQISPKSNILPLIAPYFTDRLPSENYLIFADTYQLAVIHPKNTGWYLAPMNLEEFHQVLVKGPEEASWEACFKAFHKTIAIKERTNPVCQRTHLPLWYRKHMTEFQN